jgi:hypothetical protein
VSFAASCVIYGLPLDRHWQLRSISAQNQFSTQFLKKKYFFEKILISAAPSDQNLQKINNFDLKLFTAQKNFYQTKIRPLIRQSARKGAGRGESHFKRAAFARGRASRNCP